MREHEKCSTVLVRPAGAQRETNWEPRAYLTNEGGQHSRARISAVVHLIVLVLAASIAGVDFVSSDLADPAAVSHRGNRRGWAARIDSWNHSAARADTERTAKSVEAHILNALLFRTRGNAVGLLPVH